MVLRSGIIIPFQFRDNKKLLMIGVPEENRDLSIWDLKNVVRAAFGIYNFEFRNKKIGFNIPDELLLNYLAQRHDLTNFVIEVGQVYEPLASSSSCPTCRCLPQKLGEDHVATPTHSGQSFFRHSNNHNNNTTTSSHSPTDEPPFKIRHTLNPNELRGGDASKDGDEERPTHMHIEPKIDYDSIGGEEDARGMSEAAASSVAVAAYRGDDQTQELHFERMQMQHEYYMQQQQQHHHQQQQQQQQHQQQQQQLHMEAMLQEGPTGNTLRQRKERMSKKQKEVYVNYLEQTPIMSEYKRNDPILDIYWQKLTEILNSVPQGAIKSMGEWKQAFDNWRFRIYVYARYNSKITGDAALNPKNFKPLTVTDKRAYSLWIRNPDTAPPDLDKMRNIFVNLDETQQE